MGASAHGRARRAPLRAYLLTALLLTLTVPLLPATPGVLGVPLWALGSLGATLLYAIVVAIALGRHFEDGAADDDAGDGSP